MLSMEPKTMSVCVLTVEVETAVHRTWRSSMASQYKPGHDANTTRGVHECLNLQYKTSTASRQMDGWMNKWMNGWMDGMRWYEIKYQTKKKMEWHEMNIIDRWVNGLPEQLMLAPSFPQPHAHTTFTAGLTGVDGSWSTLYCWMVWRWRWRWWWWGDGERHSRMMITWVAQITDIGVKCTIAKNVKNAWQLWMHTMALAWSNLRANSSKLLDHTFVSSILSNHFQT